MRYFSWTSVDAFAAAHTFLYVNRDGAGFLVHGKSLEWANLNARVVLALSAKMRKLCSWNQHENADPRRFRPNLVFMAE